ncbi:exo-alpha-sialidase [Mesobacterium sp. TK19101]|uniref:Exo-alpha-sialidase n=1 Tax=Mesobacterium hydrothermale TaxID=3111907 RepID=A0ABU6HFI2_9RHOB|nr:exo-alpha-sialidase [Mesobacterium sp. TK19101]MEC3859850.1 exo-alpha-sialidase [Mesobacterium sp. TK19101]
MPKTISLLIGTTKGAFLLSADPDRQDWQLSGPHCDGWSINHMAGDPATGTLAAGGGGEWPGAGVWISRDDGQSWTLSKLSRGTIDDWASNDAELARFMNWQDIPAPFDGLKAIWAVAYAHGTLWAGADPGLLLRSDDHGTSWQMVDGLNQHDSRDTWMPGAAGLVVHTIVSDPDDPARLWAAISAAGVFASEDGGVTWERRNRISNVGACQHHFHPAAPRNGETGHCVHNVVRAPGRGDLLYQQNHHGVFRSADGGRNWDDMTEGLPSTFGFPIAVHPTDPQTIWTFPLNGDTEGRFPPGASAAVWKSTDGGQSWQDCRAGLPQSGCFFTVLRQAMTTDRQSSPGVYFGTNSGSVFASTDGGDNWREIARHLPTVLSVEAFDRA